MKLSIYGFEYRYQHRFGEIAFSVNPCHKIGLFCSRTFTSYSNRFLKDLLINFSQKFYFIVTYEMYLRKKGLFRDYLRTGLSLVCDEGSLEKVYTCPDLDKADLFIIKNYPLAKKDTYLLKDLLVSELVDSIIILESARINNNISKVCVVAAENSKNVFCLPGKFYDHNSFGCNKLISEGAIPLYSFDLLKEI